MRVAVYHRNDDVRIEQRPRPEIGPGELLLRVEASGICGSDLMEWYRVPRAPLVLGHEVAGVVEAVGTGVDSFKAGDRVVATHHVPCNTCAYCLTDRHSACPTLHRTSFDPGGFSEYLRLTPMHVDRGTLMLPDNVSFDAGSFVEPVACVVRAQRLVGLRAGDDVAVLGSGISGLLHVQLACATGAKRIVTTDVSESRRKAALRFGADEAVEPGAATEAWAAATRPRHVIVCTSAKPAMEQALDLVDDCGTVLYFAPLSPGEGMDVDWNGLWRRGVSIVHSYAGPPADMAIASRLIEAGRIDVEAMISHRLPLESTGEGFRLAASSEALKVVIHPRA